MKITILGAGAFGKAIDKILTDNHHETSFYDPLVFPEQSLEAAAHNSVAVVIAIPSHILPDFLLDYPARLKKLPTILTSKGLFDLDLFQDFPQFSVLSGPAFAEEILANKATTMTASSAFAMGIFQNQQISIELCHDALGILLCGALKNIYAIGAGYYSESEDNFANFLQNAHLETKQYLADHGAQADTAELSCGLGDLILTCTSQRSRNFLCGRLLREGRSLTEIQQELPTIEGLNALTRADYEPYPLLRSIRDLVQA
ncbi:hypothetical protein IJ102_02595 [Candidatus Saccharibacteria bacterium]|nr:hypothetical protein [Candidatus Saccharibacteria bacterium]